MPLKAIGVRRNTHKTLTGIAKAYGGQIVDFMELVAEREQRRYEDWCRQQEPDGVIAEES